MMALLDLDKLARAYAEELHREGMSIHDPVSPAAVLMDLARLAGVPVPSVASEADHPHNFDFTAPVEAFGECTVCGSLPF